ncbi:MAG: NERD domain-containing protein [Actinobacteria bacterium]|nr:NERD domain-containing protein [Actinomycetota bacterium]
MGEEEEFVWRVKGEGHLITNKAGASARERAKQLRNAQPVRTRLARILKEHTPERAYRVGATGEETVGSRLDRLPQDEWMALHDIVLNNKGTNLDHLVIGPPGIFSINTKHHPKAKILVSEKSFQVNGYRTNYFPVAVHEANKVASALSRAMGKEAIVRPLIVVMGAELEVKTKPAGVAVIRRRDLPKWFTKLPRTLSDQELRLLRRVAGRPSTWAGGHVAEPSLSVTKWNRYGKRRLYVNDSGGKSLGYRDEVDGKIHVEDPKDRERVIKALQEHQRAR